LSKAQYEVRLRAAGRAMVRVTEATIVNAQASGWTVGSPLADRAARSVRSGLDGVANGLAGVRPPNDVVADNRELVAGLRAFASDDVLYLEGGDAKAIAASFARSSVYRRFDRAAKDLAAKGYTFEPSGTQTVLSISASGKPRRIKPFPFILVTRAGQQEAVDLQASFCPPQPIDHTCGPVGYPESATGRRPGSLSVVRPGEQIRLSLSRPSDKLISLDTEKLCTPSFNGSRSLLLPRFFPNHPTWRVQLPPGRYVATFSFEQPTTKGTADETGIVGLLVSRSAPLAVVRTPSCGTTPTGGGVGVPFTYP
jgi:hypothetical protein